MGLVAPTMRSDPTVTDQGEEVHANEHLNQNCRWCQAAGSNQWGVKELPTSAPQWCTTNGQ